jgi:hypothetical protein
LAGLGLAEVGRLHGRLLTAFPELAEYLRDDTPGILAERLGFSEDELARRLRSYFDHPPQPHQLGTWFRGDSSLPASAEMRHWALLENCYNRPDFAAVLRTHRRDLDLYLTLFARTLTAPTGRMRGRMRFAEARQAAYRDVADDAAKAALFAVAAAGYRVVAFAPETIVAETPWPREAGPTDALVEAPELVRRAVGKVLDPVPAACHGAWRDHW